LAAEPEPCAQTEPQANTARNAIAPSTRVERMNVIVRRPSLAVMVVPFSPRRILTTRTTVHRDWLTTPLALHQRRRCHRLNRQPCRSVPRIHAAAQAAEDLRHKLVRRARIVRQENRIVS